MSEEIFEFVLAELEKKGTVPGDSLEAKKAYAYLDAGHVDSLNIVNFILVIEDKYEIVLDAEDTESQEFRTVGGLVSLIDRKLSP